MDPKREKPDGEAQSCIRGGAALISIGQAKNVNVGNHSKVVITPSKAKAKSSHRQREIPSRHPLTTCRKPLTMDQRLDIKLKVGKQWKDLGRRLGFADSELEQLEMENRNDYPEVVYQVLTRWDQRKADEATQEALAVVFQKLGRGDLADFLSDSFPS